MRITIQSEEVQVKEGTSKRTGKPYSIKTQKATAETSEFRMPCRLTLGDDQAAYAPGVYEVDATKALKVNGFGDFELVRVLPLKRVGNLPAAKAA
jgi:hypothetical protein